MQLSRPRWAHVRREGEPWWRVLGTVIGVLAAVIAVVALLAHYVATSWQPTVILATGSHYPMWAAAVGLLAALVARRWATAGVAVVLTALVVLVQAPAWVSAAVPEGGTPVVVMQANLRLGLADPAPIVKLVDEHKVQVLATEELTHPEQQRLLAAGLGTLLPYHYTVASTPGAGNGIGMWSRYPLADTRLVPGFELKVLTATVMLPGRSFTFAAVHLLPPFPQQPGEWNTEIGRLKTLLRAQPKGTPVIAAGDYNSTVDHAQFRALFSDGYADAADQAGAGYPASYPADRWFGPLIAIDHVLTRNAVASSLSTLDLPNSDHRGLLSRVVLDPR
jgi:endonuclease/exonuclease/phosphatase (EEP) superfamily protein YafD